MAPKNKTYLETRRLAQKICKRRRYNIIKNDPDLLEQEKQNRRERYLKQKEAKKEKSYREIQEQRKKWKDNSKRYREKKKENLIGGRIEPKLEKVDIQADVEDENNANHTDTEVSHNIDIDPLYDNNSQGKAEVRKLLHVIEGYKKRVKTQQKEIQRLKEKLRRLQVENLQYETDIEESAPQIKTDEKKKLSLIENVTNFYTDDTHSVIAAGKKEFITNRNKIPIQKRYVCIPIKEHQMFTDKFKNTLAVL